ncbi:MAG: hypothetical protein ACRBI6_20575 [Acidimicrobiales bacterium]
MRRSFLVWLLMASTALGCTSGDTSAPTPTPTAERPNDEPITVTLRLPEGGHAEPIEGEVRTDDGEVVAAFTFAPDFEFLEEPSGDNGGRPATTLIDGVKTVEVELPAAGTYTFVTGASFFWGGCGTCGHGSSGGEVSATVDDGAQVEVDLGDVTVGS